MMYPTTPMFRKLPPKNNLRRSQFSKKKGWGVWRGIIMIRDSMFFLWLPKHTLESKTALHINLNIPQVLTIYKSDQLSSLHGLSPAHKSLSITVMKNLILKNPCEKKNLEIQRTLMSTTLIVGGGIHFKKLK